jgi:hypothetical protein
VCMVFVLFLHLGIFALSDTRCCRSLFCVFVHFFPSERW